MRFENLISAKQLDKVISFFLTLRSENPELSERTHVAFVDDVAIAFWGTCNLEEISTNPQFVLLYDDRKESIRKQENQDTWFTVSLSSLFRVLERIIQERNLSSVPEDLSVSLNRNGSTATYSEASSAKLEFKSQGTHVIIPCYVCKWYWYTINRAWSGKTEEHEPKVLNSILDMIASGEVVQKSISHETCVRIKQSRMGNKFGRFTTGLEDSVSMFPHRGTAMWTDSHIAHYCLIEHSDQCKGVDDVCLRFGETVYKELMEMDDGLHPVELFITFSQDTNLCLLGTGKNVGRGYTVWSVCHYDTPESPFVRMLPNLFSEADRLGWVSLERTQVRIVIDWLKYYTKFAKSIKTLKALPMTRDGKVPTADIAYEKNPSDTNTAFIMLSPVWKEDFEDSKVKSQIDSLKLEVSSPKNGIHECIGRFDVKYLTDMFSVIKDSACIAPADEDGGILCAKNASHAFILMGMIR